MITREWELRYNVIYKAYAALKNESTLYTIFTTHFEDRDHGGASEFGGRYS